MQRLCPLWTGTKWSPARQRRMNCSCSEAPGQELSQGSFPGSSEMPQPSLDQSFTTNLTRIFLPCFSLSHQPLLDLFIASLQSSWRCGESCSSSCSSWAPPKPLWEQRQLQVPDPPTVEQTQHLPGQEGFAAAGIREEQSFCPSVCPSSQPPCGNRCFLTQRLQVLHFKT